MKRFHNIPQFLVFTLIFGLALTGASLMLVGVPAISVQALPVFAFGLFAGGLLTWGVMAFRRRSWLASSGPRTVKGKRPIAVTVIAWAIFILFLVRLYQVFEPLVISGAFESGFRGALFEGWLPTELGVAVFTSAAYALLSISGIVVLISFLRMKRWSWVVLMAWTFISLTITLFDYFYGEPNYIVMASDTIIAFALNQADVQRIFRIRTDPGERLD